MRDFDSTVGSVVPASFDAYARVFHPASRDSETGAVAVPWATVARANGRVMHPIAEWGSLVGSWELREQPGVWDQPPRLGELPEATAKSLAALLAEYTESAELCWFALWNGRGASWVSVAVADGTPASVQRQTQPTLESQLAAWRQLIKSAPRFALPARDMRLLHGPLAAIEGFYEFHRHPPNLWWPDDRAWCVGTDIDLMTTYVGGSDACIEALVADVRLEGLRASVDQRVTWDADTINPLPAPP